MRMIGRLSALKASSFVDIDSKEIQKIWLGQSLSDLEPQKMKWAKCCTVGWKQIQRRITLLLDPRRFNSSRGQKSICYKILSLNVQRFENRKFFQRKMIGVDKIKLSINNQAHEVSLDGGEWYWSDGSLVSEYPTTFL